MRRDAVVSVVVSLLMLVVSATAVPPVFGDDRKTAETQLQAEARQLDADAARAASTPDGQRRVTERIARQFNVQPSVVSELRNRKLGFGGATIALALSQELMKRDPRLGQQAALDTILAQRAAGKGWGVIAHEQGLKLGPVVSEVKKANKPTEQVAGKPEKVIRSEKTDKPDKLDKPDKIDKLEKPERPSKPEKSGR